MRYNFRIILIPFSWLYGLVIWIRNSCYDLGLFQSRDFNIPVISVGNINVGGTGKTPHVEYLADLLQEEFKIATLSRGYGRKTRNFRIASTNSTAREIGDEPVQIKQRFPQITVAVDRKRVNGITNLMKSDPGLDVILLDDAYQHRSVKPGFSILLIDYNRPLERDYLLPAGRLREPAGNRDRARVILVTRTPKRLKPIEMREYVKRLGLSMGQHLYFTTIRYGELKPVFPGTPERDLDWFKKNIDAVLIVTGIASPRPIRQFARSISTNISELRFRDHHRYSTKDLDSISDKYGIMTEEWGRVLVLTTEKDSMRLREHSLRNELIDVTYSVRIHVEFLNNDKEEFDQQILNYVKSNKRSRSLYQGAN